jgi:hypothetical protein
MRNFLIWLSGANAEILERCPGERPKYAGMGGAVLTTSVMAAVSCTVALRMGVRLPLVPSLLAGLAWGTAILNLDRWLVSSIQRQDRWQQNIGVAMPRLVLALLIGLVISQPLVLRVFQPEIDNELDAMQRERQERFDADQKRDSRFAGLPAIEARIAELRSKATGQGLDLDAALQADPEVQRLQRDADRLSAEYQKAEAAVVCEKEGTCGSRKQGAGIAFREKVNIRDRLLRERNLALEKLEAKKAEVSDGLQGREGRIQSSARTDLAPLLEQRQRLSAEKQAEAARFAASNQNDRGLLARMEALDRLTGRRGSLRVARLILLLFITAIDSLAVLVKFFMSLGKPNLYERVAKLEEDEIAGEHERHVERRREASEVLASLVVEEARARHDMEKVATEEITRKIVKAQSELAETIVDEWKLRQQQRIKENLDQFVGP